MINGFIDNSINVGDRRDRKNRAIAPKASLTPRNDYDALIVLKINFYSFITLSACRIGSTSIEFGGRGLE